MAGPEILAASHIMPLDTELLEAVRVGGIAEIDAALARAPHELSVRSHAYAWDPLGLALAMGKLDLAEHLLAKGADPSSWDHHGATPLAAAVALPHGLRAAAVALLARHGVMVREEDLDAADEAGVPEMLAGLPRHRWEEIDQPPSAPMAPLPPAPAAREAGPPDGLSDLRVAAWLLAGALSVIAVVVLGIALFGWLGSR